MSRAKGNKPASSNTPNANTGASNIVWVNLELTDENFAAMEALVSSENDLAAGLLSLWVSGNDVSVKRTDKGDFSAYVFGRNASDVKCGLSAGGDNPAEALASLLVKWFDVMDGEFPGSVTPVSKRRFR